MQTDGELQELTSKGHTLLFKDCDVIQWLAGKKKDNVLTRGNFVEITRKELHEFFRYKDTNPKPSHLKVELPAVELLQYFIRSKSKNFPTFHKGDKSFVSLRVEDVDDLIEWVYEVRGNPNYSS